MWPQALVFLVIAVSVTETAKKAIYVKAYGTATIPLPQVATYRRIITISMGDKEEQIYRVCNGKNKAKCGFWENVKTKKKVAALSKTTYNKKKKALIVKNFNYEDAAMYMTGTNKGATEVMFTMP